jgi:putative Ca2+/H+ antiporter (TMEM165/GDT1 family)
VETFNGCANERGDATLDGEIRRRFPDRLEFYQPVRRAGLRPIRPRRLPSWKPCPRDAKLPSRAGGFTLITIAFFLAEIGGKTQIATVVLPARFDNPLAVMVGFILGMLAADVTAVRLRQAARRGFPLRRCASPRQPCWRC